MADLREASFSVSYPSNWRKGAVDQSHKITVGRHHSYGSGFCKTEDELRAEFEHFLLDLKLNGAWG